VTSYAAVVLGLAGSWHCVAMCGPLAQAATKNTWPQQLVYHSARSMTYALLGTLAASLGWVLALLQVQPAVALVMGVMLVALGVGGVNLPALPWATRWAARLMPGLRRHRWVGSAALGAVNGLLPCGLSANALVMCVVLPSANAGFLFMLQFGLATWPSLWLWAWLSKHTHRLRWHAPLARGSQVAAGVWLIFNGIMLIAGSDTSPTNTPPICH